MALREEFEKTGNWLFRWRGYLPFSFRNVLRREYNGFFAVIIVMFILETVGDLFVEGKLDFDTGWLILLGSGFVIWMILRSLKKYTTVLNVEGR